MKALVVGIGHPFRRDDGIGPLVAERLAAMAVDGVDVLIHHGEGTDLMTRWRGYDLVVLVDATVSGAAAGTVRSWDGAAPLPTSCFAKTSHVFGLAEAVEMARLLGELPSALRIIGIEGADFSPGQTITAPVLASLDQAVMMVVAFIQASAHDK
ncbi:MAG: putative hydrogenase maturation [Rhodospirillaceae bacterium]|nr:MAG: putative hydrogenase maturation [Rhodospirillaceae bacterium]TNC96294.1 MAG: putative hydrogenase maturation protease [Stygiobacter sp.]